VLPQPPHQPANATLNGSVASQRLVVAYKSTTGSSNTFVEASNEARVVEIEHLFMKRERVEERKK
jgi:hypothetical protein